MLLDDLGGSFCFQTFDDSKNKKGQLVKVLHGNLADHESDLRSLNDKGAGIYFTVNETDGSGRKAKNITRIRALFVDLDKPDPHRNFNWCLPPSYVIETSPGKHHCYWLLSDELPINEFKYLMQSLAYLFDGDSNICDISRVMRVPGFYHNKGEPFLVREIINNGISYIAEEIKSQVIEMIKLVGLPLTPVQKKTDSHPPTKPHIQDDLDAIAEFENLLQELSQAEDGNRNNALNRIAYKAFGISKAGRISEEYIDKRLLSSALEIGLSECEARATMKSAFNAALPIPNVLDDLPLLDEENEKNDNTQTKDRFRLLSRDDLHDMPQQQWLVRGVLPEQGLGCIFGASGTGKSFLALDLSFGIAGGREWFGVQTMSVPVVYVCLEGQSGIKKRIAALEKHHNELIPSNFKIITDTLVLQNEVQALAESILNQNGKGGLIIIDTLAQAAPGLDENSGKDMSLIINACRKLQGLTEGLVLLVAHSGKDQSKGLRGHSSLFAALDTCIEVTKSGSLHEWKLSKSKDDIDGKKYSFTLKSVVIGEDEEGEEVYSCAVLPGANGLSKRRAPGLGTNQKKVLDELRRILSTVMPDENGRRAITYDSAIKKIEIELKCNPKDRIRRLKEAIDGLKKRLLITIQGELLWLNQ